MSKPVTAVVYDRTISRNAVADESIQLHVLRKDADTDDDGLTNVAELVPR